MTPDLARLRAAYDQAAQLEEPPSSAERRRVAEKAATALRRAVMALNNLERFGGPVNPELRRHLKAEIAQLDQAASELTQHPSRRGDRSELPLRVLFQGLADLYQAQTGKIAGEWNNRYFEFARSAVAEMGLSLGAVAIKHYTREERERRGHHPPD